MSDRLVGCPVCGMAVLSARDIDEDEWHDVGRQLLEHSEEDARLA